MIHIDGIHFEVSDGTYEMQEEEQKLMYRHSMGMQEHVIRVRPQ